MGLEYYLTPNRMTSNADKYLAVPVNRERYSIEDVYEHMTREGSTLTKAEALAAFEEVVQGILNIVEEGNTVVTPLVNIMPTISGVFDSEDDRFDPNRHKVKISMSPGLRTRKVPEQLTTHKVTGTEPRPEPARYYDNSTSLRNKQVTPGTGARIVGTLLKFDESDPDQGVFFIDTADGTETTVNSGMLRNMPSELIFNNPALPAGTYRLEVRNKINGASELRTEALNKLLTVT